MAVKPYFAISSFGVPLSPNVSWTPTNSIGTGLLDTTTSDTAEPRPPIILCSSAVTIAPVSAAAFIIASASIGLIDAILITRADILDSDKVLDASTAGPTNAPQAIIVTSEPSTKIVDLPGTNE